MIANTIYKGIFIEVTINEWIILQEYTESNYRRSDKFC